MPADCDARIAHRAIRASPLGRYVPIQRRPRTATRGSPTGRSELVLQDATSRLPSPPNPARSQESCDLSSVAQTGSGFKSPVPSRQLRRLAAVLIGPNIPLPLQLKKLIVVAQLAKCRGTKQCAGAHCLRRAASALAHFARPPTLSADRPVGNSPGRVIRRGGRGQGGGGQPIYPHGGGADLHVTE